MNQRIWWFCGCQLARRLSIARRRRFLATWEALWQGVGSPLMVLVWRIRNPLRWWGNPPVFNRQQKWNYAAIPS